MVLIAYGGHSTGPGPRHKTGPASWICGAPIDLNDGTFWGLLNVQRCVPRSAPSPHGVPPLTLLTYVVDGASTELPIELLGS